MQQIKMHLRAGSTVATLVDEYNQTISQNKIPAIVRGMEAELILVLLTEAGEKYTTGLADISTWDFGLDDDYDTSTTPLVRVQTGITVENENEIHIPITDTNTQELITVLGLKESITLKGEINGFASANDKPIFVLQFGVTVRNRILPAGTGQPTPVGDSSYTKAQVDALFAAGCDIQLTNDTASSSSFITIQPGDPAPASAYTYGRVRNHLASSTDWSGWFRWLPGQPGSATFVHVAYAADSTGTSDFSFSAANSRKWRAEIVNQNISAATQEEFTDATWVKFIGDDGQSGQAGSGDMNRGEYDTNSDGIVNRADLADSASAVQWTDVTGKPESFQPESHSHHTSDMFDAARQIISAGSNTLYCNAHIISNSTAIETGSLNIDFPNIVSGGSAYTAQEHDVFTWEYHVTAAAGIGNITVGSSSTITKLNGFPEELPLVGTSRTLHVFTVRGRYKSGAVNNLKLSVNYAFSEEA